MGETSSEQVVEKKNVVLLGAGRVATHLAPALVKAGYRVVHVWSRTEASACKIATPLGVAHSHDLEAVPTDADIYIACVSDNALPEVAEQVVARVGTAPLFLHTAGSVGLEFWKCCGASRYGILYPLQTFSKERPVNVNEVAFFVEASDEKVMVEVEGLARKLSGKVFHANSERRARLHIAAVFACNFANAMYDVAHCLLSEEGIPFEVLLPLVDETSAKVHVLAPHDAQTGPAVRGDVAVMQSHMEALACNEDLRAMYALISNYINKNK